MKKIKSEKKISDNDFKIKIGTMDKKNPEVIFIEVGSYISPMEEKKTYKPNISNIERETKNFIDTLVQNSDLYKKDFIFVSDIADERIAVNKKSYFELQLFLKPTETVKKSGKFIDLTEIINKESISKIIPCIKKSISDNGFKYYKTRN